MKLNINLINLNKTIKLIKTKYYLNQEVVKIIVKLKTYLNFC